MTDLLGRLKALGEKATERPWEQAPNPEFVREGNREGATITRVSLDPLTSEPRIADAAYIVALVNAAPLLVDVAEAARIVNESYVPAIQQPTDDEWAALDSALAALNAKPEEEPND